MTCPTCGVETKNLKVKANDTEHLLGNHTTLICRVCRRKQDGKAWRVFRVLQRIGIYK